MKGTLCGAKPQTLGNYMGNSSMTLRSYSNFKYYSMI